MPPSSTIWLTADKGIVVKAEPTDKFITPVWFKSKPIDRNFCHRVIQLQLVTDSRDQGWVKDALAGSWSWFEVAIFEDEAATEPKKAMDGTLLTYRSHSNRIGSAESTRHFGAVFDRRSDLLANLQVGDVIGVRACARFEDWENRADAGYISVKLLDTDLFATNTWTLDSKVRPDIPINIENGDYSLIPTSACLVEAKGDQLRSKIWMTTPALDEATIDRIEEVQLFTRSRHQGHVDFPDAGSWSWFDIVILDSPEATVPKVLNGVSLVWLSHTNQAQDEQLTFYDGKTFDRKHEILRCIEVGNAIGVRVCAQYDPWKNYALYAQLVVRISNEAPRSTVQVPHLASMVETRSEVAQKIDDFYKSVTPADQPNFKSVGTTVLTSEVRLDLLRQRNTDKRPLRLLSLDGGGVRGICSVQMLKAVMADLTGDAANVANIRPYQYFDMMAGTSTGGLIALMLGRLKMTIGECEKAYQGISKDVFGTKIHEQAAAAALGLAMYDSGKFEAAIKKLVKDQIGDENATMYEQDAPCKVLLLSALASNVDDGNTAVHFCTYVNRNVAPKYGDWPIWRAARATSAAPVYFERVSYGGKEFVDGGLGFNNPVLELLPEVYATYGEARPIGCLLTLGTGIPPGVKLGTNPISLVSQLVHVATNTQRAHVEAEGIARSLPVMGDAKYWRLNPSKLVADLDKWKHIIPADWLKLQPEKTLTYDGVIILLDAWDYMDFLVQLTTMYLADDEAKALVKDCAEKLKVAGQL